MVQVETQGVHRRLAQAPEVCEELVLRCVPVALEEEEGRVRTLEHKKTF